MTEKWERQYQILSAIELMNNENEPTTVRDIYEYLKNDDEDITINIVNSSIRQYRRNRYIRRKHKPYLRPYQHELTNKGEERLEWLEWIESEEYVIESK